VDLARLLFETLRLPRPDNAPPASLATAWAAASTRGLARLVLYEGCALWLARRLREIGASPEPSFRAWLEQRAHDETARNMLVDAESHATLEFLSREDVPHVLLKGTARRAGATLFPYADARATHDVDILVPETRARGLWDRLRASGYAPVPPPEGVIPSTIHHLPPLSSRTRVSVELHTSTSRGVPVEEGWRRATSGGLEVERNDMRMRIPSATELLWHGAAHALSHEEQAFRLRFLLDVAVICASGAHLDWRAVAARLDAGEIADVHRARAWLGAAARLGDTDLPPEVAAGVPAFETERALRWRVAVLRRVEPSARAAEKLLGEGTRVEIGMGLTPTVPGTTLFQRGRRRIAAVMARGAYLLWRGLSP
jgi:hypothetical protein